MTHRAAFRDSSSSANSKLKVSISYEQYKKRSSVVDKKRRTSADADWIDIASCYAGYRNADAVALKRSWY